MKSFKQFAITITALLGLTLFIQPSFAQGMMWYPASSSTPGTQVLSPEESEGQALWTRFQQKQISCSNLSSDNLEKLGEYFMGQSLGVNHEAMNSAMQRMMGQQGEEQMHIIIGQQGTGCSSGTVSASNNSVFNPGYYFPMMGMMGGYNGYSNYYTWPNLGVGSIFMMIFWLIFLVVLIVLIIRWVSGARQRGRSSSSALEILKERYAKGEIKKDEFEAKKKDLS